MTTELQKFEPSADLAPVMTYAELFLKSGYFSDVKRVSEAAVKILAGKELGIPPFASMQLLNVIQGKVCMAAQLMSALAVRNGYTLVTEEWTDKVATVAFYRGDRLLGRSSFSESDARMAGTKNMGRFPKAMLHHRAVSQGVRAFTSDAISFPVYTPEEMGAEVDAEGNVIAIPTSHLDAFTEKVNDVLRQSVPVIEVEAVEAEPVQESEPKPEPKHMAPPPRKSAPIEERIASGFNLLGTSEKQRREMEEAFGANTDALLDQIKVMFKAKKAQEAASADAH